MREETRSKKEEAPSVGVRAFRPRAVTFSDIENIERIHPQIRTGRRPRRCWTARRSAPSAASAVHGQTRALQACARFKGDLLIVESEHDHLVPHPTITSFISAFTQAHSSSYSVIKGGDHLLRDDAPRKTYHDLLVGWIGEMVRSARRAGSSPSPQN